MRDICVFCKNVLDGSDEHIIPQSINGQLHSKELICSNCNNLFGVKVDPILKETLGVLLHVLKIGNSKNLVVKDEEGTPYLIDNTSGKLKQIKPQVTTIKRDDGKIQINVIGPDEISTYKAMATKAVRTVGMAALKGEFSTSKSQKINISLSADAEIKIDGKFLLALNKIIVEYYCYCNLNQEWIEPLISSIAKLQENFSNIQICNTSHNIRKPESTEISHLIVIRSDEVKKIIYAYIEIFTVICGYVILVENYEGEKVDFVYHQDAITKEILEMEIDVKIDNIEEQPAEFEHNINALFDRHEDRHIYEQVSLMCKDIKDELDIELERGAITEDEHEKKYVERATKMIAHMMVFVFPDAVEDFNLKELKEINYIHSLIKADKIEEFKFFYHQFIGHEFTFEGNESIYKMENFVFARHRPRNDVHMLKVYCCFVSEKDGSKEYWPATDVFKFTGVPFLPDYFVWL
ncbi:HNH endonuclease [Pedobacter sp. R20-19]|uniref:HNH endonuclease n=1 Tax=Pedobacter sp. R20-19 TaxID=1270196 RepID=UPI000493022B|nr:HNH endonuclease [Pedobacter sp. R20-19]